MRWKSYSRPATVQPAWVQIKLAQLWSTNGLSAKRHGMVPVNSWTADQRPDESAFYVNLSGRFITVDAEHPVIR